MTSLIPLALASLLLQAPAPSLHGMVRADDSGEPIAGAHVELPDVGRRTVTDSAGRYELRDVLNGAQSLRISRFGYEPRTLQVYLARDDALLVDVSLKAAPVRLTEVYVLSKQRTDLLSNEALRFREVGMRTLTDQDVRTNPLLAEPDHMLALGTLADVAIAPESPTSFHVRGGGSDQNLVILDGVPIYSPVHAGGSFGALNPEALSSVKLHAGIPSARFGGALSSVVEAHSRNPDREHVHASGGLSLTSARITLDGPLASGDAGFLLSGRLGAPALFGGHPSDVQLGGRSLDFLGKVTSALAGGTVELLYVSTGNQARFSARAPEEDSSVAGTSAGNGNAVPTSAAFGSQHRFKWGSTSRALSWQRGGERSLITTRLWQADFQANIDWLGSTGPFSVVSERVGRGLQAELARSHGKSVLQLGVDIESQQVAYRARSRTADPAVTSQSYRLRSQFWMLSAFADEQIRFDDRWEVMTGLRSGLLPGRAPLLEPRLAVRYRVTPSTSVEAGIGRMYQPVQSLRNPESLVQNIFGADLPVAGGTTTTRIARSDQLTGGIDTRLSANISLTVDGYLRRLGGLVLVAPVTAEPFAVDGFATGAGHAWGVGVNVARRREQLAMHAALGIGGVSTTLDNLSFQPSYAATGSLAAGLAFRPSERTTLRAALFARTGRRTTLFEGPMEWESCKPLDGGCEMVGTPQQTSGSLGGATLPPYIRIDLGARRAWDTEILGRNALLDGFLTLSNVLDRRNTWAYLRNLDAGSMLRVPMRTFIVLSAGIDWRY